MLKNISILEKYLKSPYQVEIFSRLNQPLNINNDEDLDCFFRLIYNLYINYFNDTIFLKPILDQFHDEDFNNSDSIQWAYLRYIYILKFIHTSDLEINKGILNTLIKSLDGDKIIETKFFNRVVAGEHIQDNLEKIETITKDDYNQIYAWEVELLVSLLEFNIYKYKNNLEDFTLDSEVEKLIFKLKTSVNLIDSIEG